MIQNALSAPSWLTSGAVYQINPRTFTADGTISAITKELPYLASLGIATIYLCPIFEEDASENRDNWSIRQKASQTENPKNPYRMNDYFRIDEEYGTMDDLFACVREAHRLGMHFLLDLVYLHIGPNATILKSHPEFAKQNTDGSFVLGYWNFPLLDFNHPGLREYLYSNMIYYISVLDVDGFRCDVGDGVPLDFWVEGRRRICAVKPDAIMINEGSRAESLLAGFHGIYGFSWHSCIFDIITGKKDAAALQKNWEETSRNLPAGALILRDMDNHDTVTDWPDRVERIVGHAGMDMITALNLTIDGIPMIYCGNELCDTTTLSMFANRFHPGRFSTTPRDTLKNTPHTESRQRIIRILNNLRHEGTVLSHGETVWLSVDCPASAFAFRRTDGQNSILFIGNLSAEAVSVTADTAAPANAAVILSEGCKTIANHTVSLAPFGFIILSES